LTSVVCYFASASRFPSVYKFKINIHGNWEKYWLKLLPTTVYPSIFVKSRSQNHLSVKKFKHFFYICSLLFCICNALSGSVYILKMCLRELGKILAQTVTNNSLYVNFRKIAIAESSISQKIPNISLKSIVSCSVFTMRCLVVYKCKINVYGNWEKYCLKLLPTTVYPSIFVTSLSQNRLSVNKFQTFF